MKPTCFYASRQMLSYGLTQVRFMTRAHFTHMTDEAVVAYRSSEAQALAFVGK
ncbi:hypothetical protein GCM10011375_07380 [Hymenobacter qilianensis]|uniref:Uncharacterized protein n=1 Tax=Hymenobacter qilianensis TaxID=1385715 RepID=A0ACB5PMW8_9BACT|nr:hypothetical protein GCM10011375_07380 [Hymenobacter qilianensis]